MLPDSGSLIESSIHTLPHWPYYIMHQFLLPGLEHVLLAICVPPAQVMEQASQGCQADQTPSTEEIEKCKRAQNVSQTQEKENKQLLLLLYIVMYFKEVDLFRL